MKSSEGPAHSRFRLSLAECRRLSSLVVPVYFNPEVEKAVVKAILEATFQDQDIFCPRHKILIVVDAGTVAEEVVKQAAPDSSLSGIAYHVLDRNRGKTGAMLRGLRRLLQQTDAPYVVTRDCDGDHGLEDLPRLISMAQRLGEKAPGRPLAVFGARTSLTKPMNWRRQEWERLTNRVFVGLADFLLARDGAVEDRTFWNGPELDLQSGYRIYNREGAEKAVAGLSRLPDDRETYLMACEMIPYLEIVLARGIIGQVGRLTRLEQPVSSYGGVDFASCYGRLLNHVAGQHRLPPQVLLQIFDNALVESRGYYSDLRSELAACRDLLSPDAPPLEPPGFV